MKNIAYLKDGEKRCDFLCFLLFHFVISDFFLLLCFLLFCYLFLFVIYNILYLFFFVHYGYIMFVLFCPFLFLLFFIFIYILFLSPCKNVEMPLATKNFLCQSQIEQRDGNCESHTKHRQSAIKTTRRKCTVSMIVTRQNQKSDQPSVVNRLSNHIDNIEITETQKCLWLQFGTNTKQGQIEQRDGNWPHRQSAIEQRYGNTQCLWLLFDTNTNRG